MYISTKKQQSLNLFPMHLLKKNDEWITLTNLIPWFEIENLFTDLFKATGRNALPIRVIIGSLIIQTKLGLTDRDTVDTISRTPVYQYFLGLNDFDPEYKFDFTNLCKYRAKIGIDIAKEMIEVLIKEHKLKVKDSKPKDVKNYGSLSIDASVVPVNITYPTDLKLLNKTREETEKLIDELYETSELEVKPRTYRMNARKDFLSTAKKKRLSKSARFTANRKQLQYINRNIEIIDTHVNKAIFNLNDIQKETLSIIKQIYEQQYSMWENKVNSVKDRVVNFSQPHIRGIVRGKAGRTIEFGPKIAVSKVNGFIQIDKISFNNFNESTTLKDIANDYFNTYGFYPESIRADQIYQTRDNKLNMI